MKTLNDANVDIRDRGLLMNMDQGRKMTPKNLMW